MEKKYIPERKCISCRKKTAKYELIRIVKHEDCFKSDFDNNKHGRGAYVCKNEECILNLEKRNALSRAFKTKVSKEQYEKLTEELKNL